MTLVNKPENFTLFEPVLTERGAKSRRNCVIMSLIALFIGITEQVPTKLLILGLKFDAEKETIIVWFIFAITLLLFIDFLAHAIPRIIIYYGNIKHIDGADPHTAPAENTTTKTHRTKYTGLGIEYNSPLPVINHAVKEKNDYFHRHNSKMIFCCCITIAIETLAPIIIATWALCKLWHLTS